MALNGIFYGSTDNPYIKPKIQWWAVQSEEGNYSDVTAVLSYSRTNQGYTTVGVWNGAITIDADTKTGSRYVEITYNGDTEVITHTVRVYHDSYGQKRIFISAEGHAGGTTLGSTSIVQEVELDRIFRASTLGATPTNIGEATTITVRRKNEESTHSIAYRFGELTGYIGADWHASQEEVKLTDTAISFVIPEDFYYEIPDAPSGICTLTCCTYAGDTLLGQPQTVAFTVTAQKEKCAPVLLAAVEDTNPKTLELTGNKDALVRGFSAAFCQAEVTVRNGAALKQLTVNEMPMEGTALTVSDAETGTFLFRATDSRGYTQEYRVDKTLIGYRKPTCTLGVKRTDPTSGRGVLSAKGYYYAGSFGGSVNRLGVKYRINGGAWMPLEPVTEDGSFALETQISGLDYTRANTVEVAVEDALCAVSAVRTVQKGIPVFDWGENDFAFHVPVAFHGGIAGLGQLVYPVGAIYLSVSAADPALLFGGSWERLKDVFLLAAGDAYPAGTTGGEAVHSLSLEEMPSHSHGVSAFVETIGGTGAFDYFRNNASDYGANTLESGGGQPHNNMPPYLAVYAWKRTA